MPTIAEPRLPGFDVVTWQGILAPAGTPEAVVARLAAELAAVLALPEVAEGLARQGFEVTGHARRPSRRWSATEAARWPEVVRRAGARLE